MNKIVGRNHEISLLKQALNSDKSELLAIYGRRRVGKTFLIREFFKSEIIFEVSGLYNGTMKDQLNNFSREISKKAKKTENKNASDWFDAFALLENYLDKQKSTKKKVIFIDEFPWIATAKSKFLTAFENFWNRYCTQRSDLIVVICGSAASYMIQKIIQNKGGLHNRITQQIRMLPFNLYETDLFLKSRGIRYTNYDVTQIYMAIGGVPHYLEKIQKGLSVAQNIDNLCFTKDGILRNEFSQLFTSLFNDSEKHLSLIKILAKSNKGITRKELLEKSKISSGGDFSLKLNELTESGFVNEYIYYGNKKQLTLYRLSDEYSKFYLKFIQDNKNNGIGTWQRLQKTQSYLSWSGFSFETICLKHIYQIKKALRIDAIFSTSSSWFNQNAQVDLLIDRDDNIINICEIKFYSTPFMIDKKYYQNLKNKIAELEKEIATRKNIFLTMITSFGLIENEYSQELVQNTIEIKDLFQE
ncbi:AAA family ATPase [Flavobacterium solisilvae]|uniref:AAA family ATPase n=1 Tax=Flavobacterium solisilvae TaxID=1852019 RepID=A0ABX1QW34_9FLAO|nr:ATP-binding protein [Flavobacterium solisilvae]NMH25563.1 AAA family ATPase [Flavobacterium solisilvae]